MKIYINVLFVQNNFQRPPPYPDIIQECIKTKMSQVWLIVQEFLLELSKY